MKQVLVAICFACSGTGFAGDKIEPPIGSEQWTIFRVQEYADCRKRFDTENRFSSIQEKLPYSDIENATLVQRTNSKTPTKAERAAISELDKLLKSCSEEFAKSLVLVDAGMGSAELSFSREERQRLAPLYSGKETYGEFISGALERIAQARKNIIDMRARWAHEDAQAKAAKQAADERTRQQLLETKRAIDSETAQLQLQIQMLEAQQQSARSSQLLDLSRQFMQMGQPRYVAPAQIMPNINCQTQYYSWGAQTNCR